MAVSGGRRIVIEFLGHDKSLGKTSQDVDGKVGKMGQRMNRVGAVAGKALAGGLLLAGAAAVKMTKAAAEDEQAAGKLAQTLRNTTKATSGQIKATEDWIAAQGRSLGVADDELRPALAKLVTATHDVGKAQKLASLAMDVSAGTGKDLGMVSAALAKAQMGQMGGLAKLGIKVQESTKDAAALAKAEIGLKTAQQNYTKAVAEHGATSAEAKTAADKVALAQMKVGEATGKTKKSTISFDEAVQRMSKTFSGQAAKAADTTAGKQKKMQVAYDELQEKIGTKLLPVMAKLAEWGLKTIDWMDKHQKLVGILGGAIGGLVGTLYLVSKAMAAVNLVMSLNPIGAVIVALVALGVGLVVLYKKSELFRMIVDAAMKGVGAAFKWLYDKAFKPMLSFILLGLGNLMKAWGTLLRTLGKVPGFGWAKSAGDKMYAAGENALGLRDKINKIPPTHNTKITADTKPARDAINSFMRFAKQRLKSLPANVHGGMAPGTPGFANGTSSAPRGWAWTGERGPELVHFGGGERVIPHGRSMAMASGGGGGLQRYVIDLQLNGKTIQSILLKEKRVNGGVALGIA